MGTCLFDQRGGCSLIIFRSVLSSCCGPPLIWQYPSGNRLRCRARRSSALERDQGYPWDGEFEGSLPLLGSGYNCSNRSMSGRASGELGLVGSLTGWSHTSREIPASASSERMVDTHASSVRSVPPRRSKTRSWGFVGGDSVWTSAQHRSKIVRRRSSETLIVFRLAVQRAVTKSTNCKSGIPGFWTLRDCIRMSIIDRARSRVNHRRARSRPSLSVA